MKLGVEMNELDLRLLHSVLYLRHTCFSLSLSFLLLKYLQAKIPYAPYDITLCLYAKLLAPFFRVGVMLRY